MLIKVPFCLESTSRLFIVTPCAKMNEKKNKKGYIDSVFGISSTLTKEEFLDVAKSDVVNWVFHVRVIR